MACEKLCFVSGRVIPSFVYNCDSSFSGYILHSHSLHAQIVHQYLLDKKKEEHHFFVHTAFLNLSMILVVLGIYCTLGILLEFHIRFPNRLLHTILLALLSQ